MYSKLRTTPPPTRRPRGRKEAFRLAIVALAVIGVSAVLVQASTAAGAGATITSTTNTFDVSFVVDDTCFGPGVSATFTGVETVTERIIEPPQGGSVFHVQGTDRLVYRIDVSNGAYIVGSLRAGFTFTDMNEGTVISNPFHLHDFSTIYGVDGTRLGISQFHLAEQLTLANGTVHVDFEKIRMRCP